MVKIIKPPHRLNETGEKLRSRKPYRSVFLAGSIEMGAAEDWQKTVPQHFKYKNTVDVVFYNPRRDDWDSSWTQEYTNPQFFQQVTWELDALHSCDVVFMYLSPNTKSPISLLELGLFAEKEKMIVVCPKEFWRRGNVEIVCEYYDVPLYDDLTAGIGALRNLITTV